MTEVMILRGLPGSGKDTFIRSLAESDWLKVATCSADDFFMDGDIYRFDPALLSDAHDACFRRFVDLCDSTFYQDNDLDLIVVSNTNAQLFEISPYLMYARKEHLPVQIVEVRYVDAYVYDIGMTIPELCAKRNVHRVPLVNIEGMISRWEQIPPFWPDETTAYNMASEFTWGSKKVPVKAGSH